jgi:hypothetical protein
MTPLAPERFGLHLTIGQGTHDKLRYAQELLGHSVPSGDLAQVLDRALDLLIARLEKQKFAATETPRSRPRRSSANPRHIPAAVKRAVWERDQGRWSSAPAMRASEQGRFAWNATMPRGAALRRFAASPSSVIVSGGASRVPARPTSWRRTRRSEP